MVTRLQKPGRAGGAPSLRHRVAFEVRAAAPDGYGNTEGDWERQFTVAAAIEPRFGGEQVMAARLASRQPVSITIRASNAARRIKETWRAIDVRTEIVYAIRSIADPNDRRRWLEMLCETGVES